MRNNAERNVTAGGEYIYHCTENGEQLEATPHLNFSFIVAVNTEFHCCKGAVDE